mgnify:CR=1 FL=1
MTTPQTDRAQTAVIVLAAGQGTRMKSALPKVMHPIGGRSLLHHAIAAAAAAHPGVDVAVAVPFTLIALAAERVPGLPIGAEDVGPGAAPRD